RPRDDPGDDLVAPAAQVLHGLHGVLGALAGVVETLSGLLQRGDLRRVGDQILGGGAQPIDELLALIADALHRGADVLERSPGGSSGICHSSCLPLLVCDFALTRRVKSKGSGPSGQGGPWKKSDGRPESRARPAIWPSVARIVDVTGRVRYGS